MITSKIESLSASTVTSIDIWQRNVKGIRKNKKLEHASNVTRKDILPKSTKESK